MREVWVSLAEYGRSVVRYWWIVVIGLVCGITGMLGDMKYQLIVPSWFWPLVIVGGFSVACFLAFHKARRERDSLKRVIDGTHPGLVPILVKSASARQAALGVVRAQLQAGRDRMEALKKIKWERFRNYSEEARDAKHWEADSASAIRRIGGEVMVGRFVQGLHAAIRDINPQSWDVERFLDERLERLDDMARELTRDGDPTEPPRPSTPNT
jgi:hypothetical protein